MSRLLADIGGTHSRFALVESGDDSLQALRQYNNCEFSSPEAVLANYLDELLPATVLETACFAIAGTAQGDGWQMSNCDWYWSRARLRALTGVNQVLLINDFVAKGYALQTCLHTHCRLLFGRPTPDPDRIAIFGPGTGLGGAVFEPGTKNNPRVAHCEPGQANLAPASVADFELLQTAAAGVLPRNREFLLSGPGLLRLYRSHCVVAGTPVQWDTPEQITTAALNGTDPLALDCVHHFAAWLGAAAGDFVLSSGCTDGLVLCGNIVQVLETVLPGSGFQQQMCAKGAMTATLEKLPVWLLDHPQPGLLGAANALAAAL